MRIWNLRGCACVESTRGHSHVHVLIVGLPVVRVLAAGVVRACALSDRVAVAASVPVGGDCGRRSAGVGEGSYLSASASAGWSKARLADL
jgi:hypothetical protein